MSPNDRRKTASVHTSARQAAVRASLPLDDPRDAERNRRGLVARAPSLQVTRSDGRVVWDMDRFAFLDGEAPDTVNPSLWRQEQLTNLHGLFRLSERIYQVRGYDISNITFVRGDQGWIVIDPLTSAETAAAAFALLREHVEDLPATAVIYTHSHVDHFAGVLGAVDLADVQGGRVPILAPEGFMEAAVSENVIAGPAMLRRAAYMYGALLPADARGLVGSGLGRATPVGGTVALVAPTDLIAETGEERTVDGVRIVFQVTPDTEAPAEMNFAFPELRALCMAENCTCVMHNLYTPRGAQVRDALAWSMYIHEALRRFGDDADLCFASHNWPVWGGDEIRGYLARQRDTYRYLHDQTLRLANQGHTGVEIAEMLDLPPSLAHDFNNRGYYGTVSHNVKAVYQRYLGWFDGNPANLHPLPPVEAGRRYVEFMGGAEALLERARVSFDAGEYRWVAQVVNHLVFAEPDNEAARALQADALEQLGYQAESGPWRNFYLTGAQELRHGIRAQASTATGSPIGMMRSMSVDMIFAALAVRLDGPRADGTTLAIGWVFTDLEQTWVLHLQHAALHYDRLGPGEPLPATDALLTLTHEALIGVLSGRTPLAEAFGTSIAATGDLDRLAELFGYLDPPDPRFAIVTP